MPLVQSELGRTCSVRKSEGELTQRFIQYILDERIILKWVSFLLISTFIIIIFCEGEIESSAVR